MHTSLAAFDIRSELWKSEQVALVRALRRPDGAAVLIKLAEPTASASHLDSARLSAELGLLQKLNGDHAPLAIELRESESGNGRSLVMADPGGEPLSALLVERATDIGFALRVAIALTSAITAIHRCGWVYGSLHPRTTLCDREGGTAWLTDFRGVTRDFGNARTQVAGSIVDEWLPYVSPERTGRMNRTIDYRSDYYSLGIVLYEMLTGSRPFPSEDPLQLSHAHLARTPAGPHTVNPAVPAPLGQLVMKLLEKGAERRYQSGAGLRFDLEHCWEQWGSTGRIAPFVLAEHDTSDRFTFAEGLYGREDEFDTLLRALHSACTEAPALALISGQAGMGKTALAHELQRTVAQRGGYFISGKFDQVANPAPYAALLAALGELIRRIVTLPELELDRLRVRLVARLGNAAGALVELLPDISWLIGEHPPVPRVGPTESQNRFLFLLHSLLGELVSPACPLVLFLDDLQWADAATLNVLPALFANSKVRGLLIVAAYRDGEVAPTEQLATVLANLAPLQHVHHIALSALEGDDLLQFLRDTLHATDNSAKPLAEVIERKTAGNPFFVIELLRSLRQAQLIRFDEQRAFWTCRPDDIRDLPFTDNVIDLVSQRIGCLSPETQQLLAVGACIGNRFDIASLALFGTLSAAEISVRLEGARAAGLLDLVRPMAMSETGQAAAACTEYSFIHDRIQQVAHAQIGVEQRIEVHATIGRTLLRSLEEEAIEERIFEIVEHLNAGAAAERTPEERAERAALNLRAGRRARAAAAFDAARAYFVAGSLALSDNDAWDRHYALLFELRLGVCETLHLCGDFSEAERVFEELLAAARTRLDRARAYEIRILQHESLSQYRQALRMGRESLGLLGINIPQTELQAPSALKGELDRIATHLETLSIEALVDLPPMSDPEMRTVLRLLANLHTSWYLAGERVLTLFNTAVMVRLSLEHGNASESAYAYALYAAMILGPVQADYESAYRFGTLALSVSDRLPDAALRSKVLMTFAWAISLWRKPIAESFPITRQAFKLGNETGLFVDATYAAFNESWFALLTARDLQTVRDEYTRNLDYMRSVHMDSFVHAQLVILQWAAALQGETPSAISLTGCDFDEKQYLERYRGQNLFEMFHHVAKLAICYTMDDHKEAWHAANAAAEVVRAFNGTIWDELTVFYKALTLCAHYAGWSERARHAADADLDLLLGRLQVWAQNAPYLFAAHHMIAAAEIARVRGHSEQASAQFRDAIELSATAACPREHALANELLAKLCIERGQPTAAELFMRAAYASYARWGAAAKCRDLECRFGPLLADRVPRPPIVSLDEVAVARAARAIASEIRLPNLLRTLMQIVMEAAGAQRALLIESRQDDLVMLAEATVDVSKVHVDNAIPIEAGAAARSVIQYVRKIRESIVINDAQADVRFGTDPYVVAREARSILCMPVLNHERLLGILYLENPLASGAFTVHCTEVMGILCSQAAISLENSRLYEAMKAEVEQRRVAEEALRSALNELERLKNRLQAENVYLQSEIREQHNFGEIVGSGPELLAVLHQVELVASTDATVLIMGETGTGKELIARAIHDRSPRRDRPMVKLNCSAISAGLVESELFGHTKGAFTGATDKRIGRFQLADRGTIFLDEVSELPLETQVKLLRVLQEREFEPVGSSTTQSVDVRVIAATNRNLEREVQANRFRADLFYRLNVFPIAVPPLRARPSDIPQLVLFFLDRYAKKCGKNITGVGERAMAALVNHPWPGNVRDLQNFVERAVILSQGPLLEVDLNALSQAQAASAQPIESRPRAAEAQGPAHEREARGQSVNEGAPEKLSLGEVERNHLLAVLRRTQGVIDGPLGAARILVMKPSTLRFRIKKLGIARAEYGPMRTEGPQ